MSRRSLTWERLTQLFWYDPETGHFTRLVTVSNAVAGSLAGSAGPDGYRRINIDRGHYRANVLAWFYMTGEWPAGEIDHVNTVTGDDRWTNLRLATHRENAANAKRRRDNTSGIKGVRLLRGKWQVRIGKGGSNYIGTYDSLTDAAAAYATAAEQRYGKFARTE